MAEGGYEGALGALFSMLGDPQVLENAAQMLDKLGQEWVSTAALLSGLPLNPKDFLFIMVIWLIVWIRIYYRNTGHNMQQLGLFYWVQLASSVFTGVLSVMRLFSFDFRMTSCPAN